MTDTLPESAKQRVRNIMTTEVISVHPETRVSEVARLMSENSISGLPVVDDNNQVLGVITELDMIVRNTRFKMPSFFMILDMIFYLETPRHFENRLEHMLGTTAAEIMSEPAVTIAPDATIEELAEIMVEQRKNPIPVVDNGQLIGIVSRNDIIRQMAQEFTPDET